MTSLLKVDEIQDAAGKKILQNTGSILQVQTAFTFAHQTISTTTWTDVETVDITPTSSSSNILIRAFGYWASDSGNQGLARLTRDSTKLGINVLQPISSDTQYEAFCQVDGNSGDLRRVRHPLYVEYIDSPATTSQITYKVQVRHYSGGNIYMNRWAHDTNWKTPMMLSVTEISA